MPIIDPKTDLRSLSYKEFGTIGDPLVVKDIPAVNQDGPSKGVLKQVTARTDDALRMTRLLVLQGGKRNPAGNKFTANLALLNQQESLDKIKKLEFKGLGKSLLGGAADTGKTLASILAQVPVAGTGTHFVNGGKVGKEYLKGGGGNAIGNLLRGLVGADGLQGHERVLAGRPININRQSVDDDDSSLLKRYKGKVTSGNETEQQRDSNLRQPFKQTPEIIKTRLASQGDQGKYAGGLDTAIDKINESNIYENPVFRDQDIIPFEFQIFDPKNGGTPKFLYFRAYISSFSDNFTGEWNSTKYIGRAENLYNYTGFNRAVDLSFTIAAHTQNELMPLYKKLNYLVGSTAPSYNQNQTFMRGVFTKLTVGDYLMQVPGFFTGINLSWDTIYPWELGFGPDYEENNAPKVPHLLNVSMNFTPVHDFNPELNRPFITNEQFLPFSPKTTEGIGRAEFTEEGQTFNGQFTSQTKELDLAKSKVVPPTRERKFKQFVDSAKDFIQKTANVNEGEQEIVKTVNIPSENTEIKSDENLNFFNEFFTNA